jgi:hypothetical protein
MDLEQLIQEAKEAIRMSSNTKEELTSSRLTRAARESLKASVRILLADGIWEEGHLFAALSAVLEEMARSDEVFRGTDEGVHIVTRAFYGKAAQDEARLEIERYLRDVPLVDRDDLYCELRRRNVAANASTVRQVVFTMLEEGELRERNGLIGSPSSFPGASVEARLDDDDERPF